MTASARVLAAASLGALLHLVQPAAANPSTAQQQAEAHYKQGTLHYNLGEYAAAIAAFKEAYRLDQNAAFLYNIAQAARLSGDLRQALTFYRSYLNARPDAPNRIEIQGRIAELDEAIKKEEESKRALPTAVKPPEPSVIETKPTGPVTQTPERPIERGAPIYKKWWFWTGVAVVAAGATTIAIVSSGDDTPSTDLGNFPVF